MEKSKVITFSLIAVLTVALILTGLAYLNSYNQQEVKQLLDSKVSEVQAQNDVALDALQQEYDGKIAQINEKAQSLLDEKEAEMEALQAEKDAEIASLSDEITTTQQELASEANVEETYPTGKVLDNIYLGDIVSFSLDDGDLNLLDTEITFNDDNYDVHEEFYTTNGNVMSLYSALDDEEFGAEPYIGLPERGALNYKYVFDDAVDMTEIDNDEPLTISLLGKEYDIVKADSNEIVIRSGDEYFLNEGDSIEYNGKNVTLAVVSDNNKVTVLVDGVSKTIDEFDSKRVNGLDVGVEDILSNDRTGYTTLVLGEDTLVTMKDGDNWMDNDDSPFKFNIESSGDNLEGFIVSYDEELDEIDGDYPVLGVGDSLSFPNNYVNLLFEDASERDYISYDFKFDDFNEKLYNDTIAKKDNCVRITTDNEDIDVLNEESDEVYVCGDKSAYYQDNSNDWYEASVTDVSLVNDDAAYTLDIGGAGRLRIENNEDFLIRLDTNWVDGWLGAKEDEAEASDVILSNDKEIGKRDYDVLTSYGAVIKDVENNADKDSFEFLVPTDRVELTLVAN